MNLTVSLLQTGELSAAMNSLQHPRHTLYKQGFKRCRRIRGIQPTK